VKKSYLIQSSKKNESERENNIDIKLMNKINIINSAYQKNPEHPKIICDKQPKELVINHSPTPEYNSVELPLL